MRFKKGWIIAMSIFLAAAMVGCGGGTATTEKAAATKEVAAETSESQKISMPEERPILIGKVKEIVGNEVTIFKAEVDQNGTPAQEAPVKQTQNQNKQQENNQNNQQVNPGARMGNGGFRMNFSEETETFMIPVGVQIVSMQRGSQEATDVGITAIKKDSVLRIWKTNGEISFVQVTGGSSTRTTIENTGNNQRGPQGGMEVMGPPPGM
ncbi:hypothetical protein JCM14036_31420 [Desulfotomaculum defluvii]